MAFSLAPRHAPVERDEDEAPEVGAARPVGRRGGLRVAPAQILHRGAGPRRAAPAPPAFALGQLELADGFVALVTAPGAPWLANAIALGAGDVPGRRRRRSRSWGLTPGGDDLLAGACITAAAVGDPLVLPPGVRTLTTALSATLIELAAAGAGPMPVHALLDLGAERWRGALRELEGLGASSGSAIALGVGAAAVVLGGRAARSVPPPAARHFVS